MDKQQADRMITEYLPKIYGFAARKSYSYDETQDLCADIVQEVRSTLRELISRPLSRTWSTIRPGISDHMHPVVL